MANELVPMPRGEEFVHLLEDSFASFVDGKGFAKTTEATYRDALKRLAVWLRQQKKTPLDVGIAFRNYLTDYGYSPVTINLTLSSLSSYFSFLVARSAVAGLRNPFAALKVKTARKRQREYLSAAEARKLLLSLENQLRPIDLRDRAIIHLMLTTGLRVSSVAAAEIKDVAVIEGTPILRIKHKGRAEKDDFVVLAPRVHQTILAYLECLAERFDIQSGRLFRSHSGRGDGRVGTTVSRGSIAKALKARLAEAGLGRAGLSPHSLRRTAITLGRKEGATLEDLRAMAGHSSIKTTEGYDHARRRVEGAPEIRLDKLFWEGDSDEADYT